MALEDEVQVWRERVEQELANARAALELMREEMARDIAEGKAAMQVEIATLRAAWEQWREEHAS